MKNLYYVVAYNFQHNHYMRLMMTHASEEAAREYLEENLAKGWALTRLEFICRTSEDVSIEV